jgi:TatD DNase family protein
MCVDIRLKTNPDLEIVRENAADDDNDHIDKVAEPQDRAEVLSSAESSVTRDTADEDCAKSKKILDATAGPEMDTSAPIPARVVPVKRACSTRQVETKDQQLGSSKRARMDPDLSITVIPKPIIAQRCPYPNCQRREKKIKRHVQRQHLPKIFCDIRPVRSIDEIALCQLKYSSMMSLVVAALGEDADLSTAVDYVNRSGLIPKNTTVHSDTRTCMRRLCTSQGWTEPEEGFTVAPINSPAALFHWRCLIVLLSLLQPFQREEFRTNGRVTSDVEQSINTGDGMVPIVDSSTEDDFTVIDVSYGSDIEVNNPAISRPEQPDVLEVCSEEIVTVDEAFDSHFHLDRTSARIWKTSSGRSVEELISYGMSCKSPPSLEVTVPGGVIVYSEPCSYPEIEPVRKPWGIAVGVHPKHTDELTPERFLRLKDLLDLPYVVALGEVGLDRTVPVKLWRRQEEVLRQMLTLARKDRVIVLHLRGTSHDRIGMDVHARCMQILQKSCHSDQPIHLHCFTGDSELVKEWMDGFSCVYFGFTGAVENFSKDQIAGLKSVPMNRMLLETDSPYMRPGGLID